MRKAIHEPGEMSEDDTHRVTEWMTAAFLARQNEFSQFRQGLLDSQKWEQSEHIIHILVGVEWVGQWWTSYGKHIFTGEFVACVERIMAGESYDAAGAIKEIERWSKANS